MATTNPNEGILKRIDLRAAAMYTTLPVAVLGLISGGVMMTTRNPEVALVSQRVTEAAVAALWGLVALGARSRG